MQSDLYEIKAKRTNSLFDLVEYPVIINLRYIVSFLPESKTISMVDGSEFNLTDRSYDNLMTYLIWNDTEEPYS